MTRGNATQVWVIFRGKKDNFFVIAESEEAVNEWRTDGSIPLAQVVAGFKILYRQGHSTQSVQDHPSNETLQEEFKTTNQDEIIMKILREGNIQTTESSERQGPTNDTMGPMIAH